MEFELSLNDHKDFDLPDSCKECKLMYFYCDFSCWHGSEECLQNLRHHQKKGEKNNETFKNRS